MKISKATNSVKTEFKDNRTIHPVWQENYDRVCADAKIAGVKFYEVRETYRQFILERDSRMQNFPEGKERQCKGIASIKAQYLASEKYPNINLETGEVMQGRITYDIFALPFSNTNMHEGEFKHNLKIYLERLKKAALTQGDCRVYPADLKYEIAQFDGQKYSDIRTSKLKKIW